MTAQVIHSLGTSSRDYSTFAAWAAAMPTNLVTADENWIAEAYADSEFVVAGSVIDITGVITDATRHITVRCATGQSFRDNANKLTNALTYNAANGVALRSTSGYFVPCFRIDASYTELDGLQIYGNYGSSSPVVSLVNSTSIRITGCIFLSDSASAAPTLTTDGSSGSVTNCLMLASYNDSAITSTGDCAYINCTAVNPTGASGRRAYNRGYATPTVINCIGFGLGDFGKDSTGSGSNNATDLAAASFPGGASGTNKLSLTVANEITSYAYPGDYRVKSGAQIIGGAIRQASYTNDLDIVGQARSTTTPTMGCWEYVSAGAAFKAGKPLVIGQAIGGMY